ncbi:MAG: 3-oxoacyl-ACP reductase FabG [FCB group bacterium]|nr:3-oxoacyl-ACP reductase FabG [FCB group bacterium]
MKRLKNKIAVITGAGRGIGRATAIKFAREGAQVVIAEYDTGSGKATESEILRKGQSAEFIAVDVSDESSVNHLFDDIGNRYGRVDVLVNNAGILQDSTLKKLEPEQFDRVISVNLRGVYLCTRRAGDLMREQGSGVILNASSVVAHYGNFGQTNYVAAKAGVIGMTKVWARELGKDGIRVNAVAPGFIATDMTAGIPEKILTMMAEKVPLKRMGDPEDIANAYCFLASDEARYINGAVLNVDGGVVV